MFRTRKALDVGEFPAFRRLRTGRALRVVLLSIVAVLVAFGVFAFSYWATRYRVPSAPGPASIHTDAEANMVKVPADGFRFAVLGDMPADVGEARTAPLRDAVAWEPDFMFNVGDVTAYAKPENWREYIRIIRESVPDDLLYYHTPGNHDVDHSAFGYHPGFVRHYFGRLWYWVDAEDWRFVFLDTSDMEICEERMRWLDGVLRQADDLGKVSALVTHAPPREMEPDPAFLDDGEREHAMDSEPTRRLSELVKNHDVRAVFAGHLNRTMQFEWQGIPVYVTGMDDDAWDHGPVGYHRVEVRGKEMRVDCVWLDKGGAPPRVESVGAR